MAAHTMVPKGPTARQADDDGDDGFDRDALLAKLFALPIPPQQHRTKPYPIHTPLGRIMRVKGLLIRDVDRMPNCPNQRVLCDYLAGRKPIAPHHRGALARGLGVDVRLL